jgi:hypothetical protein
VLGANLIAWVFLLCYWMHVEKIPVKTRFFEGRKLIKCVYKCNIRCMYKRESCAGGDLNFSPRRWPHHRSMEVVVRVDFPIKMIR